MKSGLSRRQRKNCRKREKGDSENKQLLGGGSTKSSDVGGTAGSSILSSGSSSSLNSQKEGSVGCGKKRSVPLKEREGYGRYATLETYEHLKGMPDQHIYYWIYRYISHAQYCLIINAKLLFFAVLIVPYTFYCI